METRIVVAGRLPDPGYSPFPGSRFEDDELDGPTYWPVSARTDQDRDLVDEEDFQTRLRDALDADSQEQPGQSSPTGLQTFGFPVNAASKFWKRGDRRWVFLVGRFGSTSAFLGVGNAATSTRNPRRGTATVQLSTWRTFADPVDVDLVLSRMPRHTRHTATRLVNEEDSRALPPAAGADIRYALAGFVRDLDARIAELPAFPQRPRRVTAERLPKLDAEQSALRFFDSRWRSLEPVSSPTGPPAVATRLESILVRSEDESTTDDTGAFLDWDPVQYSSGGWFEFRSGDRQLLVKNINFTHSEVETGADLVYVRYAPASVVLVQYKLLTADQDSTDYFFRDDGRLGRQLERMLAFSSPAAVTDELVDDYRLAPDIGFVKFLNPSVPRAGFDVRGVPEGRYHPARGVQLMLRHPSAGSRGGPVHRVRQWRSLDGQTFTRLVRDQWVGSVGAHTEQLLSVLGLEPRQRVTLAVEQPLDSS